MESNGQNRGPMEWIKLVVAVTLWVFIVGMAAFGLFCTSLMAYMYYLVG